MAQSQEARPTSAATTAGAPRKIWFITGTSRGLGRIWTEAALKRGDRVAAAARTPAALADLQQAYGSQLLVLEVDVTNPEQVTAAVRQAHAHFGRLDVVVNNAGYSLVGTIEEASAADVRALYDTNIFGSLAVIQAALPLLRAQGHGHIIGVSSTLGLVAMPLIGYYCSSKWAFEAIHESLAAEIKPFGLHVTLVEPGAYDTEFGTPQSLKHSTGLDVYADFKARLMEGLKSASKGDPQATPAALFALVDAPNPPLRLFLGNQSLPLARAVYAERLATWEAWAPVSNAAQGTPSGPQTSAGH
ncbi:SDR family NAD(P)-dependent oxidoreductase [Hymenobacter sp. CRA2]|uniref:SDR family NAD(P)-dependent oxidoreductase n=1 Tax=Hymenobacter sp. CRA2 TaxID=1955620 RepID=UPI00098EA8F6|nr:SDR family NAD(P)-dependent oxidoreductase [Hymenobacter sp. CRA2]OON69696.1 short-chain dehydrogenase/reductase [Hymenobacter sp. CRA2]